MWLVLVCDAMVHLWKHFKKKCLSGCKAELVQLAVRPALAPAVAGASEKNQRTFRYGRSFLLPLSPDTALLQPLPLSCDWCLFGAATSGAPSWPSPGTTLLHWTGTTHWSGKMQIKHFFIRLTGSQPNYMFVWFSASGLFLRYGNVLWILQ